MRPWLDFFSPLADASFERLRLTASFLDPPIARERQLMHHGEQRTMRFRSIFSRDTECPEGRYIVIELEQA